MNGGQRARRIGPAKAPWPKWTIATPGGGQCTFDVETAVTSLAPFLAMPSFSYFLPTMKPVMF
jgi:hypothetical protein